MLPATDDDDPDRANFAYAVEPGQSVQDAVVVTNDSTVPLHLGVYGTDAFTTTSGNLDLLPAGDEPVDLGSWLTLDVAGLDLEPGQSVEVPFTLQVPDDASPGDHSGGVVTSLVQAQEGSTLTYDRRLALRVHARVAGALAPALEVSDVELVHHGSVDPLATSTATLRYTVTNTGNARVVALERGEVTGPAGWARRGTGPTALPELLPGSSLEREVTVAGVRPLGRATAEVVVDATAVGVGGGALASASGTAGTWAVPWALLAVVLLVVVVAVLAPGRSAAALAALSARRARSRARAGATSGGAARAEGVHRSDGPEVSADPTSGSGPQGPVADDLAAALERARAKGRAQALAELGEGPAGPGAR
ncbi:DUF916 domain-containing protein [Cellulosimicrobium arenosum]|uniref:DUF916 domain-containing protein n=2 Tax=Cellulosimicrobium arenosum TaxID=2708133 RepID=A0A927J1B3_9MICO|nr:DUF916 domain-containing protein [Cellulosimicrobium arenosum]MBD8080081.1 DUF916 domain-containing protein [Cellulosimicrobium arenosum]